MRAGCKSVEASHEFETPEGCWILEVANDDGDEELSIARARVAPGATTQWHELSDTNERYVVVQGRGRVEVGGLPPADVGPGDVVRIPARTPQRIGNTGRQDLVFYCICTPPFRPECYARRDDIENSQPHRGASR